MKKMLVGFVLGLLLCSGIVCAANYLASDITYVKEDGTETNVSDAISELYVQANNIKILKLGTGTTHSYDMKSLYPNDYQNFTVDNFIIEVNSGSNNSKYSCSECYFSTTNHTSNSSGSYSLQKKYDATTGIFTASATISSSGSITRYNGTFWSHSGSSALTSSVYFTK